ncbi:hypothetical protein ACFH04_00155 [Streptomyces noboritoensis]|uniref:Uncharacterized protein n=1 Tax=Streptomyces noboritoensis TaxID=67337 RepID=A0ABV6T8Q6_9ACTN
MLDVRRVRRATQTGGSAGGSPPNGRPPGGVATGIVPPLIPIIKRLGGQRASVVAW